MIPEQWVQAEKFHNKARLLKRDSVNKYEFEHELIGAIQHKDGTSEVFYHDEKENWFVDKFDSSDIYKSSNSLTFSELFNLETLHDNDLNNNGWIGDQIEFKISSDGNGLGLYRTMSGAYIVDNNGLQQGNSPVTPTILIDQVSFKEKQAQ